jgi:hypothetical protein
MPQKRLSDDHHAYLPSPEEIRAECAKLRAERVQKMAKKPMPLYLRHGSPGRVIHLSYTRGKPGKTKCIFASD